MEYLPLAFIAGILTVLTPCVLPILPVIISGSIQERDPLRPLIITLSLALSVILFTLLLKFSTIFINVPASYWQSFSGGIILIFGIITLWPNLWSKFGELCGFHKNSNKFLVNASQTKGRWGMVLLGASLGPVFASCSPVYFLILATILPVSFFVGLINLLVYGVGLMLIMFAIAYFGQRAIAKSQWAVNPRGWFRRTLGGLLILIGILIFSGLEKQVELSVLNLGLSTTKLEEQLLEKFYPSNPMPDLPSRLKPHKLLTYSYAAPELKGLTNWINTEGYESLDELKGKVVLIDFWTYSCINCIRTLPHLKSLHEKYADDGLVILGIHAPEFQFEKKIANVQNAVTNFGITYPVVQDNDFSTWRNYENRYWPAKYLIDREGNVRYTHFGEGDYEETEEAIVHLLNTTKEDRAVEAESPEFKKIVTHETYLGISRRKNNVSASTEVLPLNKWKLHGLWQQTKESVYTSVFPSSIHMNFSAAKAFLVMGGDAQAEVYLDGEYSKTIQVNEEKLYEIADYGDEYGEHLVEIRFTSGSKIQLYAWTFG